LLADEIPEPPSPEEALSTTRQTYPLSAEMEARYPSPAKTVYRPETTVIAQVPEALLKAASLQGETRPSRAETFPSPSAQPKEKPPGDVEEFISSLEDVPTQEEIYYRQIFDQFVETKKQCGEPVAGLTYEKFAEKLIKNTNELKERYQCRTVKFQVHVKNGKAALKATPQK
jgi:hypothetical protein